MVFFTHKNPATYGGLVSIDGPKENDEEAAIVTGVNPDGTVNLTVFSDRDFSGTTLSRPMILRMRNVSAGPNEGNDARPGCWSWPPRVA